VFVASCLIRVLEECQSSINTTIRRVAIVKTRKMVYKLTDILGSDEIPEQTVGDSQALKMVSVKGGGGVLVI
jgi:hypothetical protein